MYQSKIRAGDRVRTVRQVRPPERNTIEAFEEGRVESICPILRGTDQDKVLVRFDRSPYALPAVAYRDLEII